MTTAPFPPEWVDATLTALAGRMSTRTSPAGIAAAVLDVVVPLVRADEARRIAEDLRAQAAYARLQSLTRSAAYFDFCAELVAARIARKTLYADDRIVREEIG